MRLAAPNGNVDRSIPEIHGGRRDSQLVTFVRAVFSCSVISVALCASANSSIGKLGKITERLVERGLTPAHITIEYALTDGCNITGLRVTENSHPDALGPETVDEVVSVMIGPFSAISDELIELSLDDEPAVKKLSTTTRTFSWRGDDGHRYLVCGFYADGSLQSARLTDGRGARHREKIEDRIVDQALSELPARTIRASFVSEDD